MFLVPKNACEGIGLNGLLFPLDPRRAARLAAKTALAARLV